MEKVFKKFKMIHNVSCSRPESLSRIRIIRDFSSEISRHNFASFLLKLCVCLVNIQRSTEEAAAEAVRWGRQGWRCHRCERFDWEWSWWGQDKKVCHSLLACFPLKFISYNISFPLKDSSNLLIKFAHIFCSNYQ